MHYAHRSVHVGVGDSGVIKRAIRERQAHDEVHDVPVSSILWLLLIVVSVPLFVLFFNTISLGVARIVSGGALLLVLSYILCRLFIRFFEKYEAENSNDLMLQIFKE
jgi:hypothetical protein